MVNKRGLHFGKIILIPNLNQQRILLVDLQSALIRNFCLLNHFQIFVRVTQ